MSRAYDLAFPTHPNARTPNCTDQLGLTIREHFAAMAMAGSLGGAPGQHLIPENLARESVAHADALLAELAKVKP